MTKLAWGSHPMSGVPVEGRREIGDRCPNCDYPIDLPVQGEFPVVAETTPSTPTWTCSHCGWTISAPHHDPEPIPQPGVPNRDLNVNPYGRAF
jgi:rubredoxin